MEIKTTEFFKNLKSLPSPGTTAFSQLVDWEVEKSLGGVRVNGVLIPGWLYFHLNHWWIRIDRKDNYGNIVRDPSLPALRDNEWIRAEALENCKQLMKGYMEVGLRQGGKSEFEASVTGYNALMFQNTQNVIVGGNDPDLTLLKDKVDFGLKKMWKGLAIPRIDKDWRKPMVKLGYKYKNSDDDIWSYLIIRNADDGKNTESAAGTTAKAYVMDEIGKYSFGQVFEAAKPAFLSEFGWRTIPILVGTGGSFEKGADAERFFNNPDSNNFLAFIDPETGKKTCLFMSGLYRQDCKITTTLDKHLISEGKLQQGSYPELEKIEIRVADKEKALEVIQKERIEKAKDPDQTEYLKAIMYHPLTPEECFLSSARNIFNIQLCKKQKARILENNYFGSPVILSFDGEKVLHTFTDKKPISSFPIKQNENKDAPIMVYEFPIKDPPFGLYVMGVDPYRQSQSEYSDSLGAVYVFKRMHDIQSEKYQHMIVASYVARPDFQDDFNEQARLLARWYNARVLSENDELSFINYMIHKGDAKYLESKPEFIKQWVPNTKVDREYGIHRSAEPIRNQLHNGLKRYLEEKIGIEYNEEGVVIKEHYGVNRILDLVLLEEIINYNEDGNFDRIVAVELAIALANHLDPIMGRVSSNETDPRLKSLYSRQSNKGRLFNTDRKSYTIKKGSKLFTR